MHTEITDEAWRGDLKLWKHFRLSELLMTRIADTVHEDF